MDAPGGYGQLRESAAWLDLSARGKIKVSGEDRARLLHAMTTNDVQRLTPGAGCYVFFLSAQGRILADAAVLCRPDHLLLDTEPENREKIYAHLDHFIIADDVALEDLTDSLALTAVEGPQAGGVLRALGAPAPEESYANEEWGARLVVRASYTGGPGWFIIAPASEREELTGRLSAAGAVPATPEAFHIVRLEHGKPRHSEDLSERLLAQEANQPHALNFHKGCYLGQEIVERVRSRAQIHRVLMPLEFETDQPPAPGSKLAKDGANVIEVTSAAFSPALGKVVALGLVRADLAKPGTLIEAGGIKAQVR